MTLSVLDGRLPCNPFQCKQHDCHRASRPSAIAEFQLYCSKCGLTILLLLDAYVMYISEKRERAVSDRTWSGRVWVCVDESGCRLDVQLACAATSSDTRRRRRRQRPTSETSSSRVDCSRRRRRRRGRTEQSSCALPSALASSLARWLRSLIILPCSWQWCWSSMRCSAPLNYSPARRDDPPTNLEAGWLAGWLAFTPRTP